MAEADFQGRLLSGERILWTGAPPRGFLLTGRDGFMIPFSVFFCGFSVFWMWSATKDIHAAPTDSPMRFFPLFGVPFVLFGIYALIGRFFADAWIRGATRYAVTNQRVLVLRTFPRFQFTAFAIDRLPELSLDERADGRGTIRFQPRQAMRSGYNNSFSSWTPSLDMAQFLMIPDARTVFDRIQKAARP